MSTDTSKEPLRLAIVGGGIGGLALLLGILHHVDKKVIVPHLYESAAAFSEIGAGVAFGPNAVRSMYAVDPKLHQSYLRIAAKAPVLHVEGPNKVAWHHFLMGMDGRGGKNKLKAMQEICTAYNNNRTHNVHRASFLDQMLKMLPGQDGSEYVTFKKRLADIEELTTGDIRLHFTDGSSTTTSAVIGCDGVKSRTRQILLTPLQPVHEIEPQFTGKYAYRGLIPMEEAVSAIGEQARVNLMFWGYGGHLVTFPIDQGRTFNCVAFQSAKGGDGRWPHGDQWVVPSTVEDVLDDYKEWCEPVRRLLSMLRKPEKWALFDHPPANTFHKGGKIGLLGDCAHASTPHQGAGAGMAIEDAAVLSNLLGQVKQPDVKMLEHVFEAYDQVRRPRSQKLVTTSREAGLLYDLEQPGIDDDVEKIQEVVAVRYKWLWEHDTEGDIRRALELLADSTS